MKLNNAFENDARVFKEASSLGKAGFQVVIVAKYKEGLKEEEDYGSFLVKRVKKQNPIPLYSILKALWQEKADVYHAHDLDSLPPSFVVAKLRKSKITYDSHEYWRGFDEDKINWKRRVFLFLERLMVPKVNLLISVNPTITDIIAKNYHYAGDKLTLYNAPLYKKPEKGSPIKPISKASIIHVGAIQKGRGMDVMVKALKYLPSDYALYMLGPDNYPGGFLSLAKKEGVASRVKMLGVVDSREVTKYVSFADLALVLTQNNSLNYYYSLPNKLFESISSGLPVVASDMQEISRVVREEKIGEICKVDNPKDIAMKIERVYEKRAEYLPNVARASKKYCWENEEKKLVAAYKKMI